MGRRGRHTTGTRPAPSTWTTPLSDRTTAAGRRGEPDSGDQQRVPGRGAGTRDAGPPSPRSPLALGECGPFSEASTSQANSREESIRQEGWPQSTGGAWHVQDSLTPHLPSAACPFQPLPCRSLVHPPNEQDVSGRPLACEVWFAAVSLSQGKTNGQRRKPTSCAFSPAPGTRSVTSDRRPSKSKCLHPISAEVPRF